MKFSEIINEIMKTFQIVSSKENENITIEEEKFVIRFYFFDMLPAITIDYDDLNFFEVHRNGKSMYYNSSIFDIEENSHMFVSIFKNIQEEYKNKKASPKKELMNRYDEIKEEIEKLINEQKEIQKKIKELDNQK